MAGWTWAMRGIIFFYRRPWVRLIYVRSKWKVIAEEKDNIRI